MVTSCRTLSAIRPPFQWYFPPFLPPEPECKIVYTLQGPEKLQSAFRDSLALPRSFDITTADLSIPQWDSVAHLQLVVALEDSFRIRLDPADVVSLNSYCTAIEILRRHGAWHDA
jgi:acyl carrier protein